jgi:hypothetical protein
MPLNMHTQSLHRVMVTTKKDFHMKTVNTKKDLHWEIADTKKAFHKVFNLRIQGTIVEIEMRILVETIEHGLENRLREVKTQRECASCGRTGTSIGGMQSPKFGTSTSVDVF